MDTFENPVAVSEDARRANDGDDEEQQRPEAADHGPAPPDDEPSVFEHAREIAQQKVDRASDGVLEGAVEIDVDVEATLRAAAGGGTMSSLLAILYLLLDLIQRLATLTMPDDFIEWPEEWLAWMRFSFGFSFGFFGVLMPRASGWALLVVPALILARG